jgi:hypothetical protein
VKVGISKSVEPPVNSTEPLVIVDGVPVPSVGALNSFNPNDIENIFPKRWFAAIYGSRAAVVCIDYHQSGKSGKVVIDYNGSTSIKKVGLFLN